MTVSNRFKVGAAVEWIPDSDRGEVLRVIPGAIAVRWFSTYRTYWYSLCSGAMDRIALVDAEEVA